MCETHPHVCADGGAAYDGTEQEAGKEGTPPHRLPVRQLVAPLRGFHHTRRTCSPSRAW